MFGNYIFVPIICEENEAIDVVNKVVHGFSDAFTKSVSNDDELTP